MKEVFAKLKSGWDKFWAWVDLQEEPADKALREAADGPNTARWLAGVLISLLIGLAILVVWSYL